MKGWQAGISTPSCISTWQDVTALSRCVSNWRQATALVSWSSAPADQLVQMTSPGPSRARDGSGRLRDPRFASFVLWNSIAASRDSFPAFPELYRFGYEQHCLGTPNSGRSYARRAHASRSCPRSWMSPSVGSILGEQGQQPADQCRLYARQHRTGA